ncbi:MAG TPA: AbrB family transcriptional regulator, partial [Candidatus Cloacimonadota bacterium]|nr:AbrB family transcriptional regulator [Candidatus Cloacimonadota bacterium]
MNAFFHHLQSWWLRETVLVPDPNPLVVLAFLLIIGAVCARIARKLHVPTGATQILGGIIIGQYILNIFDKSTFAGFESITNFALGFIGYTIGSHLNFRKLHNAGRRIFLITISDVIITPLIVFLGLHYILHIPAIICLLIAAISISTAPGSILHVVKEMRAKGIFTKTLLAVLALNNVLTIFTFYLAYNLLYYKLGTGDMQIFATIAKAGILLLESIIIGGSVGMFLIYFTEKRKVKTSFLALIIISIVVTTGTSELLHLSGLLSSLILGIIISNYSRYNKLLANAFKDIEMEVFTLFFVLAGTHLNLPAMREAGIAGLILIFCRVLGKSVAPTLGAYLAGSTRTIKRNIGYALYPIGGVAIGLVLLIENDPFLGEFSAQITAIVLTAVIVNELLGPIFTGKAIKNAGENHKNRLRLMDFLQEEYVLNGIQAKD